jgi:hypothetical protein
LGTKYKLLLPVIVYVVQKAVASCRGGNLEIADVPACALEDPNDATFDDQYLFFAVTNNIPDIETEGAFRERQRPLRREGRVRPTPGDERDWCSGAHGITAEDGFWNGAAGSAVPSLVRGLTGVAAH